jgi:hypothetical protein
VRFIVVATHILLTRRQRRLLPAGLLDLPPLLLLEAAEGAAFVRMRIFDQAVDFASFVSLWQVLRDRKTFRITEE